MGCLREGIPVLTGGVEVNVQVCCGARHWAMALLPLSRLQPAHSSICADIRPSA